MGDFKGVCVYSVDYLFVNRLLSELAIKRLWFILEQFLQAEFPRDDS